MSEQRSMRLRLHAGVIGMVIAFYVMADPGGTFTAWPLLKSLGGGVFMAALVMGLLEAGLRIGLQASAGNIERTLCFLYCVAGLATLLGFALPVGQRIWYLLPQLVIGMMFYWLLLRNPALALNRAAGKG